MSISEEPDHVLGFKEPRHCGGTYQIDQKSSDQAWRFISQETDKLEKQIEDMKDLALLIEDGMMCKRQRDYWRNEARRLYYKNKKLLTTHRD